MMNTDEEITASPINTQSILSLVFGMLTLLFFCTGWLPIPFTGILCFPFSLLFGTLALVYGAISLRKIRSQNESGRPMAWTGIMIGGFVFICILCMVAAIISLFIYAPNSIPMPPFLDQYQL